MWTPRMCIHGKYLLALFSIMSISGACETSTSPSSDFGLDSSPDAALNACIQTEPDPPTVDPGDPVTLMGTCSSGLEAIAEYRWDLGDGRQERGPVIHPRYPQPGQYRVTLTIVSPEGQEDRDAIEVAVKSTSEPDASVGACFIANPPDLLHANVTCTLEFDASCSTGKIAEYRWFFAGNPDGTSEDRTVTTTSPVVEHSWEGDSACFGMASFDRTVRLTVVGVSGEENTIERAVNITNR